MQKDVDYMDDTHILSEDTRDLEIFNKIMLKFEAQSGAILSRDRKTKVMGLGKWRGKEDWPQEVSWMKTVQEMDVLGFVICPAILTL